MVVRLMNKLTDFNPTSLREVSVKLMYFVIADIYEYTAIKLVINGINKDTIAAPFNTMFYNGLKECFLYLEI
jgi:hypothetical protein